MAGKEPTPGLRLRGGFWHIDKRYRWAPGGRLREATGYREGELEEAEAYYHRRLVELRETGERGKRPIIVFREAGARYLQEHMHLASIGTAALHLEQLDPWIGNLPLDEVCDDTLQAFKAARLQAGKAPKSINNALALVRRICNLAARSWRYRVGDGAGGEKVGPTWLETAPLITMLPIKGRQAEPYPLDWEEQEALLGELPGHLFDMALYNVNTGTREQEVCQLEWAWESCIPELRRSVFIVPAWVTGEDGPAGLVKNREDRLVVHNRIAQAVIEKRRRLADLEEARTGIRPRWVFWYRGGEAVGKMHNSAWKRAWRVAGLPIGKEVRKGVHNLKHSYGRRLRAAGVPLETRRVLLGHTNGDITTHYSEAEIAELIRASDLVCERVRVHKTPTLRLIKGKAA